MESHAHILGKGSMDISMDKSRLAGLIGKKVSRVLLDTCNPGEGDNLYEIDAALILELVDSEGSALYRIARKRQYTDFEVDDNYSLKDVDVASGTTYRHTLESYISGSIDSQLEYEYQVYDVSSNPAWLEIIGAIVLDVKIVVVESEGGRPEDWGVYLGLVFKFENDFVYSYGTSTGNAVCTRDHVFGCPLVGVMLHSTVKFKSVQS